MNNIKKLRQQRKLTLIELADRLNKAYAKPNFGFSKATIDRWEKGKSSPSLEHAAALADFFGVTLDEVAGRTSEDDGKIDTIAAHIEDGVTEEEMDDIRAYIEFIKSKRKRGD